MAEGLYEVCEKLLRDAGSRKVMVCSAEGDVLAHAGSTGALDEATGEAIASLVGDVINGAQAGQFPPTEDVVATLQSSMTVCAAPIGTRAALVVLFDNTIGLERVRTKMRRARDVLMKTLPTGETKTPAS
jgi:hypothetical protein